MLPIWIEEGARSTTRSAICSVASMSRAYRMGPDHASVPVILSLIDQLHVSRHHVRTLTCAVAEQPEAVQREITRRMAGVLRGK